MTKCMINLYPTQPLFGARHHSLYGHPFLTARVWPFQRMRGAWTLRDESTQHTGEQKWASDQAEPKSTIGKGKVLHSQAREIIWNVYKFFERQGIPSKTDVQVQTALATGVSSNAVRQIVSDATKAELATHPAQPPTAKTLFITPGKKRPRAAPITGLDDFDMSVVRVTVAEIYREGDQQSNYPTVQLVLQKLKEKIGFKGGSSSLRAIMKKLGMRYGKINQRQFYIEKLEIVAHRRRFLRQVRCFRQNPDQSFIYLDETWVNEHHAKEKMWHD